MQSVDTAFVLRQVVQLHETAVAQFAFESFAGVPAHVSLEIVALGETLAAVSALEGLLTRMDTHVHTQTVASLESFAANFAYVRLDVAVVPQVRAQVGVAREALVAVWARKRFLAVVPTLVHHEIVVSHESGATFRAEERFRFDMRLRVLTAFKFARKFLTANLAIVRRSRLVRTFVGKQRFFRRVHAQT